MDKNLRGNIDKFIEENYDAIFRDIARLVAINSVEGESAENAPFGPGPRKALDVGLQISRELGLEAVDCGGMIGYAQIGSAEKYIATITHLDVVPTGDGWTADPFTMREREGWIMGRGVLDDKGPSVLCLYALKYLKEHDIPLRYAVRALLGVNEETGMKDVSIILPITPHRSSVSAPTQTFLSATAKREFTTAASFPTCRWRTSLISGVALHPTPYPTRPKPGYVQTCLRAPTA